MKYIICYKLHVYYKAKYSRNGSDFVWHQWLQIDLHCHSYIPKSRKMHNKHTFSNLFTTHGVSWGAGSMTPHFFNTLEVIPIFSVHGDSDPDNLNILPNLTFNLFNFYQFLECRKWISWFLDMQGLGHDCH